MNGATISSLHDLPPELLIKVFRQINNLQLLTVQLVCRYFRDIIHSTPSFWSLVKIGSKQYTPDGPDHLNRRLERAANLPLDVVIRDTGLLSTRTGEQCLRRIAAHRNRIRSLEISTDTAQMNGEVLYAVLLSTPAPSSFPSLHKLDVRHNDPLNYEFHFLPMEPQLLRPIGHLFPALTTLMLCPSHTSIPVPDSPILFLTTLVLDGSLWDYAGIFHVAQFLIQTPNLQTFWYKEQRMDVEVDLSNPSPDPWGSAVVNFPVRLFSLTKMSVTVPGLGSDLLRIIEAPALQDLHLDGTRNDERYDETVAWLSYFPDLVRLALRFTASYSPGLRRLSLVRVYLPRDAWEWILGCGSSPTLPFPHLESIAVREMEAIKWEVTNVVDDVLLELYAQRGRLVLRRFAYMNSEPPLRGAALHRLINGVCVTESLAAGQTFELELDGTFGIDTKDRLGNLLTKGVRAILHEEPPQRKAWWMLGKDIDPTESDSY